MTSASSTILYSLGVSTPILDTSILSTLGIDTLVLATSILDLLNIPITVPLVGTISFFTMLYLPSFIFYIQKVQ